MVIIIIILVSSWRLFGCEILKQVTSESADLQALSTINFIVSSHLSQNSEVFFGHVSHSLYITGIIINSSEQSKIELPNVCQQPVIACVSISYSSYMCIVHIMTHHVVLINRY